MFNKEEFTNFENKICNFYQKLEELLNTNERVSINIIQNVMNCGFNTAINLKSKLIELQLINSNGEVM